MSDTKLTESKLTIDQSKLVEDNHKLIYWYLSKRGLSYDEWYDLFAIELCYTAMAYDKNQGSFSNYFKLRCDWLVKNNFRISQLKKNQHIDLELFDGYEYPIQKELFTETELCYLFDGKYGTILKMVYEGYTQEEIAHKLGKNQSYVSNILKKIRKSNNYDR